MQSGLIRFFALGIFFAANLGGCRPETPTSEIKADAVAKSGDLASGLVYPGRLILAKPSDRITVCGDFAAEGANAIKQWAVAAGRDSLVITADCAPAAAYRWTVLNVAKSLAKCRQLFPAGDAGAFTDITTTSIYICSKGSEQVALATLLHEFGHAWGMCDQYAANVGNGASDNCDPKHSSAGGKVPNSVMGASYTNTLLPDDISGIKRLAARTDIPSYAAWHGAVTGPVSDDTTQPGGGYRWGLVFLQSVGRIKGAVISSIGTADFGGQLEVVASSHSELVGKFVKVAHGDTIVRAAYPQNGRRITGAQDFVAGEEITSIDSLDSFVATIPAGLSRPEIYIALVDSRDIDLLPAGDQSQVQIPVTVVRGRLLNK